VVNKRNFIVRSLFNYHYVVSFLNFYFVNTCDCHGCKNTVVEKCRISRYFDILIPNRF